MSSQTFCNLDKFCVNETEKSSFKSAICYSHGLLKKKIEDVLLLHENENKVFMASSWGKDGVGEWDGRSSRDLPGQHTQYEVQHKKGADDDEGDEVQPVPSVP